MGKLHVNLLGSFAVKIDTGIAADEVGNNRFA